ncbi:uncharacterized protein FIESC28_02853 [Fusarium coffeatum]|uniref:F-box domain-containing protein n=1 Tax=Fusarium coffeatum TaxID=231269 RepID=A0A366S4W6_9HYPO|nr:uncharacterized protein FIESC28_02853 [Fusarium coffeatum]RBR24363.1 hypothetical protein FIESC28_02853 [Fusarium coffeatum]
MNHHRTSFLLKLPTEIIGEIFKACHLSDHLNLALTCRRLADGGKLTLARHKTAARDYGVVTDWHHLNIPDVLNKAISDPYFRYNIRKIGIHGTRYNWENWGDFRAEPPPTVASRTFEGSDVSYNFRWRQVFDRPSWKEIWGPGHEHIGAEFDEDAMTYAMLRVNRFKEHFAGSISQHWHHYILLMARLEWFSTNGNSDDDSILRGIDWAQDLLHAGNDSLLKALLICICPRLNVLRHASCKLTD